MLRLFYNEITLLAFLVASILIVGCGKTDPIGEYGVKGVPKHNQKTVEPNDIRSPFVFEVPNGTIPDFVDGQAGTAALRVRVVDQHVTGYDLEAMELPPGAKLTRVDYENWTLNWTPNKAIQPNSLSATYKVSVEIWVTEATDERYKKLNRKPHTLSVNVRREGLPPSRENPQVERNDVKVGEKAQFSMEIKDAAAAGTQAPEFSVLPSRGQKNDEFYKADGSQYVKLSGTQKLPSGNWKYNFEFDLTDGEFPSYNRRGAIDPSVEETLTCFSIKFKSPSKLASPEYEQCFRVLFRAAKPENKSPRSKVTVGRATSVSFDVQVPSKRGKLALDASATDTKNWPGAPELKCQPVNSAQMTIQRCAMNWKIECDAGTATQYDVKIKAVHEVAGEKIEAELIQPIDIERSDKVCKPAATPVPTAAPATPKPTAQPAAKPAAKPATETKPTPTKTPTTKTKLKKSGASK